MVQATASPDTDGSATKPSWIAACDRITGNLGHWSVRLPMALAFRWRGCTVELTAQSGSDDANRPEAMLKLALGSLPFTIEAPDQRKAALLELVQANARTGGLISVHAARVELVCPLPAPADASLTAIIAATVQALLALEVQTAALARLLLPPLSKEEPAPARAA